MLPTPEPIAVDSLFNADLRTTDLRIAIAAHETRIDTRTGRLLLPAGISN